MTGKKRSILAALAFCAGFLTSNTKCEELIKNGDFRQEKDTKATVWRTNNYGSSSQIKLKKEKDFNTIEISSEKIDGKGNISQYLKNLNLPPGSTIKFSCEYKTKDLIMDKKGRSFIELKYNFSSPINSGMKRYQQITLPPSKEWRTIESTKKIDVGVKDIRVLAVLYNCRGSLEIKKISAELFTNKATINKKHIYIWREAESNNIKGDATVSDWKPKEEKANKDFFSGEGGLAKRNMHLKWNFIAKEYVNQESLLPEKRTYYFWIRNYGYLESPPVEVFLDSQKIASFKTVKIEQTDEKGIYKGGGGYYWQYAGKFSTTGKNHRFEIKAEGRCCIDCILATTDPDYKPFLFEAREAASNDAFKDVQPGPVIKPVHSLYGVSDKLTSSLGLMFYMPDNKPVTIKDKNSPAKIMIALPKNVILKEATSHWAGSDWKTIRSPFNISWKKSGSKEIKGKTFDLYEMDIYCLWGRVNLFIKGMDKNFAPGNEAQGFCWMELNDYKQAPETINFKNVALTPAPSFKKIFIGPSGGNTRAFFLEYPELSEALKFTGINFLNIWHSHGKLYPEKWNSFLEKCRKNKIMITSEHSPFYGFYAPRKKEYLAVDLEGKITHKPSIFIPKDTECMQKNIQAIKDIVRDGLSGITLDDEEYNQQQDNIDYNERVKAKFKEYLEKNTKLAYKNPVEIVKNKKNEKELYNAWVKFKCEMLLERYRIFYNAYIEEYKKLKTDEPELFLPIILKNESVEESKAKTFWDYKKLAEITGLVSPMIYTYQGIKDSANIGDIIKMYNDYIGRPAVVPTLLAGHGGFGEIPLSEKKMIYYQIIESLMQRSKGIIFWCSYGTLDPLQLQYISSAFRATVPYEKFFLEGQPYDKIKTNPDWIRKTGLKLNGKLLVYVSNYRNNTNSKVKVSLPLNFSEALDLQTGKKLKVKEKSFETSFSPDSRGKLFLINLRGQ